MAQVYRILVMDLNQFTDFIVDLLVKASSHLVGVHFFDIPNFPA